METPKIFDEYIKNQKMKIDIPKTLKIGGHEYKVICPYTFKERSDSHAQLDFPLKEIRISGTDSTGNIKPDSSMVVSFIHEILHAVDFNTGHMVFDGNEKAVDGFSECIYQILVDNGYLKDA